MTVFYLLGCAGFILMQGFFAASEISFVSSRLLTLRHRQHKGDMRAAAVYRLVTVPERLLVTTLVGTNLSAVLSTSLLTLYLIHKGVTHSNLWIMLLYTPAIVIFAELIPKNIARHFREHFSCAVVGGIEFFTRFLGPAVNFIGRVSKFLIKFFTGRSKVRSLFVTKEELRSLVRELERQGGIDRGEKEAIEEVFDFQTGKVKDVGVKLNKVVCLSFADSYEKVLQTVRTCGFIRYPVLKDHEFAGYVNVYDLFYATHNDWHAVIRPIIKVGVNQKLYEVFTGLKSQKQSIALVMKGKKVWGIITLQDLVHEVVSSLIRI